MSLPASVDWTSTYFGYKQPNGVPIAARWQLSLGTCQECSLLYAMELCGILTGQPVVQLSQLFSLKNGVIWGAQSVGVCSELLWPVTLAYGPQTWIDGTSDYQAVQTALATMPTPICYDDAPYHKLLTYSNFQSDGTLADKILKAQTAIAAGYPLLAFKPPNHEVCIWGYGPGGYIGMDSMSPNPIPFQHSYSELDPWFIIKTVHFTASPVPYPPPAQPPTVVVPPPAPPKGNTQMLIDTFKSQVDALVFGQITATQLAAIDATRAQIVPDVVVTPPPPPANVWAVDTTTRGTWKSKYGADGYNVVGDTAAYPSYAAVSVAGSSTYTWAAQTSDARALQRNASGRIAACLYGSTFDLDVQITDSAVHQMALYLLDWDSNTRVIRIDQMDPSRQTIIATQTVSLFNGGAYIVVPVQGHVVLRFTKTGGANAVLSGLFFDA